MTVPLDCEITFDKPSNGIVSTTGFGASGVIDEKLYKSLANENCWYEKHSKSVILRPNIEASLKDMALADADFTYGDSADWEVRKPLGFGYNMLYHKKTSTSSWVKWQTALKTNQAFVVWFSKLVGNVSGGASSLGIYLLDFATAIYSLMIDMRFGKEVVIYRGDSKVWQTGFPQQFTDSNTEKPINFLICMFINDWIILGFNGLESTVGFKVEKDKWDGVTIDQNGREYPILAPSGINVQMVSDGVFWTGYNQLYFESNGELKSQDVMPGYQFVEDTPSTHEISNHILPKDNGNHCDDSLEIVEVSGAGSAYKFKYALGLSGCNYGTSKAGYSGLTPAIFSFKVADNMIRTSAPASPYTLDTDILQYTDNQSEGRDGSTQGASSTTIISGADSYYPTILAYRNRKMDIQIEGNTRATHLTDTMRLKRPEFGKRDIEVSGFDYSKRCRNAYVLSPAVYDGERHGDIMQALAELAGVSVTIAGYSTDPVFPVSIDTSKANWEFKVGTNVWDAMQTIRQYSGWVLYFDANGVLQYKPRPTSSDAAKYTFRTNHDLVTGSDIYIQDLEGEWVDWVRTRVVVRGKASERVEGKYERDQLITVKVPADPSTAENEIGETRIALYIDPSIANEEIALWVARNIFSWYTKPHVFVNFTVPEADGCLDIWLYDVLNLYDAETNLTGKYLIRDVTLTTTQKNAIATIQAMEL